MTRKKRSLLNRTTCRVCCRSFAEVCLHDGRCSECSKFDRVGTYGISVRKFNYIRDSQGGVCAICRKAVYLNIDHDHNSGIVRGLLCQTCNNGLGMFDASIENLERAAQYLSIKQRDNFQVLLEEFDRFNNKRMP